MRYRDFTSFLNAKFFRDEPNTLDDEWIDAYEAWFDKQDPYDLVKYADEYASLKCIEAVKDFNDSNSLVSGQPHETDI